MRLVRVSRAGGDQPFPLRYAAPELHLVKKSTFPTPQDAENAFYEALEAGELEAMMEVWAEDEEIVCVHPGGARLAGGQLQALYGALFCGWSVDWKRERWDTPDGDFIDVDRLAGPADSPLVVLFHGLEGGSSSHYARALARELRERAWRCAVPHFRGCSGEPNLLPRAYHSGDTEEIGWILPRLRCASPGSPP